MKASKIEFRLRMAIMVIVVVLGFWSPWIEAWGTGHRISTLVWLAIELSRAGLLSFSGAVPVVIVLGALIAAAGAVLRVWGTAYLGYGTVHHEQMQAGVMMADGPYRYVRNPLYVGGWCMMAAMAFLMPPTGALFAMTLLTVFLLRLILAEEAFLTGQLGEAYREYLRAVLSELNPIGVFIALAVLSWSYSYRLMLQGVLVSFGLSLVVRALMPRINPQTGSQE